MAVGPDTLPELYPVPGFRLGVSSAGIKTPGRLDLVVMEICQGASVAGVFTRNAFCAAPVQVAKQHLQQQVPAYFLVNTGNANAGTGARGIEDSRQSCFALASHCSVPAEAVLPFSTGVIGEVLPVEKILSALPAALEDLDELAWARAAEAIMTTDTRPKAASRQLQLGDKTVTVTGIAKGAGMIKPNMATMLAYIATDAAVSRALLDLMLQQAVEQSFNRITIDGDTSTNDACMLVATAQSGMEPLHSDTDVGYSELQDLITEIFIELAQGLVRDGEGASKFVTVAVKSAGSEDEALLVAYTVAESPLVKTALFASDPNWGRLLAAIGRAGIENLDVNAVSVSINGVLIAEQGCRADSYTEAQGTAAMKQDDIIISIDLERGQHAVDVWTSDLSDEYVRINAEYRT
jgi:glutamate N-acetyltransferase/amino-acid N-acetyltransferase